MCIIFIVFNVKHDYNENSFFVRGNKLSISEATVRVSFCLVHSTCSIVYHLGFFKYRGADKSLVRPGRKQAWKHVWDARDFNNIETRAVIKYFFLQVKAPKEIQAILTETLARFLPGRAKDLSAPLYTKSGSLISLRKRTFFCYFLRLRLVVPFMYFIQLFFIKKTYLCASTEEIFRLTNKGKKRDHIHYRRAIKAQTGSRSIVLLFL